MAGLAGLILRVHRRLSEWTSSGPGVGILPAIPKLLLSVIQIAVLGLVIAALLLFDLIVGVCCCVYAMPMGKLEACRHHPAKEGHGHCLGEDECRAATWVNASIWRKHLVRIWVVSWSHFLFSILAIASCSLLPFVHKNLCDADRDLHTDHDPSCCHSSCHLSCQICDYCKTSCCKTSNVAPALSPTAKAFQSNELPPMDPRHVVVHPFSNEPPSAPPPLTVVVLSEADPTPA